MQHTISWTSFLIHSNYCILSTGACVTGINVEVDRYLFKTLNIRIVG